MRSIPAALLIALAATIACSDAPLRSTQPCSGEACAPPAGTLDAGPSPTTGAPCTTDADCAASASCLRTACVSNAVLRCEAGKKPIIQVAPSAVEFGSIRVGTPVERPLVVRNIGDCALTIMTASIDPGASPDFSCTNCTGFPKVLLPFERETFTLKYTATDATPDAATLSIVSSDPAYPLLRVPLKSENKGVPTIALEPPTLNFGFVPVGSSRAMTFTIRNTAVGDGVLEIREANNRPLTSTAFRLRPSRALPAYLNAGESMTVEVTYRPLEIAVHHESAAVASSDTRHAIAEVVLIGYSSTPPDIAVTPRTLDWGQVGVGQTEQKPVRIQNNGEAGLSVSLRFATLTSTDFSYSPTSLTTIGAHGQADIYVALTATATGAERGQLIIASNDPDTPEVTVDLTGTGTPTVGTDVIKIEMTFDNGSSGWATSDFRNVDLYYESPYGQSVSKAARTPDWGIFGHPRWQSYSSEEPEVVIHADPGATNGDYKVRVDYVEDCEDALSPLVAAAIGIAVDVLVQYLSQGVINIPGLGGILANLCTNRSGTDVQVKILINGTLTRDRTVRLARKGDVLDVFTVRRTAGIFSVL